VASSSTFGDGMCARNCQADGIISILAVNLDKGKGAKSTDLIAWFCLQNLSSYRVVSSVLQQNAQGVTTDEPGLCAAQDSRCAWGFAVAASSATFGKGRNCCGLEIDHGSPLPAVSLPISAKACGTQHRLLRPNGSGKSEANMPMTTFGDPARGEKRS
jgi:hypothetical protein